MTARGSLAALLLPLALLSACGDDSTSAAADPAGSQSSAPTEETSSAAPSETTTEPSPLPDWPACAKVWVSGADIPAGYKGCLQGQQSVRADNLGCSSGQRIVRYDDRFFGVAGGQIYMVEAPLDKNKQYLAMVRTCRA